MSTLAVEVRGYFIDMVIKNGDNTEEGVKGLLKDPDMLAQINGLCEIAATLEDGVQIPLEKRKEFFTNRISKLMGIEAINECPICQTEMSSITINDRDIVTGERYSKDVFDCGVCSFQVPNNNKGKEDISYAKI
ncbi:hypothetical protein [Paenibacillus silvae]|uniref:Uncharacterized protein n=1 Tax=Paenibacillus silvae TaxID=1325358 RepID=A0A2W6PH21_9BACL|nr:hypothetical protein [Paenibacillus silvae]PZT57476.1 hypothetical protein DN757_02130 [Paenibacillus silvae]